MRAYADTGPISGNVFAAIIGALGALQIAAVLAEPIPQFKDGGTSDKDQVGMINDGGVQEYVKRGKNILTTKNKNALVDLKKNDIIYKNYDEMMNDNSGYMISGNALGTIKTISPFDYYNSINKGIIDGFKNSRINNNIKLVNKTDNYARKVSRWN